MINFAAFKDALWLAEPSRFEVAIAKVRSFGNRCFTGKEIAKQHRKDLERARELATAAMAGSGRDDPAEIALAVDAPPKAIRAVKGKVGVIPIWGPVQQRLTSELIKAGGTSLDFVSAAFDRMMDDPAIGAVVFHNDSPGGESFGVQELSDKIFAARNEKPIYNMIDSMGCSAACWIGSSAGMSIISPGGITASVGVYRMHIDETKALETMGVTVTLVTSDKYKGEMLPVKPLTDEAKQAMQDDVDALHEKFIGAMKRNRNTTTEDVRKNYGQGRFMRADAALAAGLVDRVMSFDDLMAKLTGVPGSSASGGGKASEAEAFRLRMQHERRKREREAELLAS